MYKLKEKKMQFPNVSSPFREEIKKTQYMDNYDYVVAIPLGAKYCLWFTLYLQQPVCILYSELEPEKFEIIYDIRFEPSLAIYGSFFYGTVVMTNNQRCFLIEDVYMFRGEDLRKVSFQNRARCLDDCFTFFRILWGSSIFISLVMWEKTKTSNKPFVYFNTAAYEIQYYQYRSNNNWLPFLRQDLLKQFLLKLETKTPDTYRVFENGQFIGYAGITSFIMSQWMRQLFTGKIKTLEILEDSDSSDNDEDDDGTPKEIYFNCFFESEFQKWIPQSIVV